MPAIVLVTLNARYSHASLGLRYLLANLDRHGGAGLRARAVLREFTISRAPQELANELLALNASVISFGVYIWNVTQTLALVRLLKSARPELRIVLGGPEVSHELETEPVASLVQLASHVITGWGDVSFPKLCQALLYGPQPLMKIIPGEQPALSEINLPYAEYTAEDLAHRLLYVEASRGCPFKCEFCLSSLDKTAWAFDLDLFLSELDTLYQRGARTFKFVDRTFNLKIDASLKILQFFLDRLSAQPSEALFVHFEVIPDHLPDKLKAAIAKFPPGVLQFEIGIQSFNVDVQQRISRRQDNAQSIANLHWLREHSQAHLHTDLIFGLPGETLASFAQGFDALYALRPHEIQLGILKRLRGTPIARHAAEHGMVFDSQPPYAILQSNLLSEQAVQRFTRLARYWELLANSGKYERGLALLLSAPAPTFSPFAEFSNFADWLWARTGETSGLTPELLLDALFDYLTAQANQDLEPVREALRADYIDSGARANPNCLRAGSKISA